MLTFKLHAKFKGLTFEEISHTMLEIRKTCAAQYKLDVEYVKVIDHGEFPDDHDLAVIAFVKRNSLENILKINLFQFDLFCRTVLYTLSVSNVKYGSKREVGH